jgi:D-alanine-D-alanine ligase-like ATP-grasp enzyme
MYLLVGSYVTEIRMVNVAETYATPNIYPPDDDFDGKQLMRRELLNVGFSIKSLGTLFIASNEDGFCWLDQFESSFQSHFCQRVLADKVLTRRLLKSIGVSCADGFAYTKEQAPKARQFARRIGQAVIKPARGLKGLGVSVDVRDSTFDQAWDHAWKHASKRVLIERFFDGEEARYMVLDGKCVAVVRRIPPTVYGDGVTSISDLVHQKNVIRSKNPNLRKKLIELDDHRMSLLKRRGLDAQSVPQVGEQIVLDSKGNISTGADPEDITDIVHSDYKEIVESISSSLPGAHIIGVDVLSKDHTKAVTAESYIVIEANTGSGLLSHYYPMYGNRRNIFRMLAQSCADRLQRSQLSREASMLTICESSGIHTSMANEIVRQL